jgi:hypothetical protein
MEVRGYFKPEDSFHTISEWEEICQKFLDLQKKGFDTRGGSIDDSPELIGLINTYFSFQLYIETERYPQLTRKIVLDFIEDFVNHKVWGLRKEYNKFITNIENDRIAFFYSRGAIEPYILLNENFTKDTYRKTDVSVTTLHWTSKAGLINIIDGIKNGYPFQIATFTTQAKEFFRPESNILVKLKGNLVAAFKSDAKTFATDKGHRAANMLRLYYPDNESNLCRDWKACSENKTSLWNEIVIQPTEVIEYKQIKKY